MELKNFYAIVYVNNNVLRTRFTNKDEWSMKNEKYGYFLIQTPNFHFSAIEYSIQQLETIVKIIYRRYFLFERYNTDDKNGLLNAIKEVEKEYEELHGYFK